MTTERYLRTPEVRAAATQRKLHNGQVELEKAHDLLLELANDAATRHDRRTLERMAKQIYRAVAIVGGLPRVPGLPPVPKQEDGQE